MDELAQPTEQLNQQDLDELSGLIGIGAAEIGGPLSDAQRTAIRKLGVDPVDWNGHKVLSQ
jgi:hypothetical protein